MKIYLLVTGIACVLLFLAHVAQIVLAGCTSRWVRYSL